MKIVILDPKQMRYAKKIAENRNDKKEGVKSRRINQNISDYAIHFYGAIGEVAFAELIGLNVDSKFNPNGGDEGYDFDVNGLKIDVKYSRDPRGSLLFKNKAGFKADVAVFTRSLVRTETAAVQVVGWTTKDYFFRNCEEVDLGRGKTLLIRNNKLFNMESLQKRIAGGET